MLATKQDFEFSIVLSFHKSKPAHTGLAKLFWSLIMLETGCMSRFVPQSEEEIGDSNRGFSGLKNIKEGIVSCCESLMHKAYFRLFGYLSTRLFHLS